MDEDLRVYLAAMEQRMIASILRPIDTKMDDILDRLSRQITKLEDELRQLRSGSA